MKCLLGRPAPKGRQLLDREYAPNQGDRDFGESMVHIDMIRLMARQLEQRDGVAATEAYYPLDDGTVFDLVAFSDAEKTEMQYVVEAERLKRDSNRGREDVLDDYEKLQKAGEDVEKIWVVESKSEVKTLFRDGSSGDLEGLFVRKKGLDPISHIDSKGMDDIRAEIRAQDADGIHEIWLPAHLRTEVTDR